MVSLTLMARLLEALRPDARLVLVGDPDQLASVEAGAVLGDLVGPAGSRAGARPRRCAVGRRSACARVVTLTTSGGSAGRSRELADAIRDGDADAALAVLAAGGDPTVRDWSPTGRVACGCAPTCVAGGRALDRAAPSRATPPRRCAALDRHRLLCAHRTARYGVPAGPPRSSAGCARADAGDAARGRVVRRAAAAGHRERLRARAVQRRHRRGRGRDRRAAPRAAFARGGAADRCSRPRRLRAVQTVHAMTVHRGQGSQFDAGSPSCCRRPDSPLLTRELLYTAVTRAREHVRVVGTAEAGAGRGRPPGRRASGLRHRLAVPAEESQ